MKSKDYQLPYQTQHKRKRYSQLSDFEGLSQKLYTLNEIYDRKNNVKKNKSPKQHDYQDDESIFLGLQFSNRIDQINSHCKRKSAQQVSRGNYQEIQNHLIKQNINLKEHNNFLFQEAKRYKLKLKKCNERLILCQQQVSKLQRQNELYRMQYLNLQEYVYSQKIQNLEKKQSKKQFKENLNQSVSQNLMFSKDNSISEASKIIQEKLVDLSDQFEAAMYQYKQTKNIQTRKLCLEITKEMRKLKQYKSNVAKTPLMDFSKEILSQNKQKLQPTPTFKPSKFNRKSFDSHGQQNNIKRISKRTIFNQQDDYTLN